MCANKPLAQKRLIGRSPVLVERTSQGPMPHSPVGYFTKQENIAVAGVADMVIRSLLDKQQFHDPLEAALRLGISSATWPLFGLLWPSGARMAERLAKRFGAAVGEVMLRAVHSGPSLR